jgi:hypothetical protein
LVGVDQFKALAYACIEAQFSLKGSACAFSGEKTTNDGMYNAVIARRVFNFIARTLENEKIIPSAVPI